MKTKSNHHAFGWLLYILILAIVLFFVCPIPNYLVESPGSAEPLAPMVKVGKETDHHKGDLMLTTVRIQQATPYLWLKSKFDSVYQFEKQEDVMGKADNEEYQQLQTYYMDTSENLAKAMALSLAKKPYDIKFEGIYVMQVAKNSKFKSKLKVGDFITKFNGKTFKNADDAIEYIQHQKAGEKMTLTFQRKGKTKTVTAPLMQLENKKIGIGITLVSKSAIDSNPKISINAGDIGGPSAGLMFTLQCYELLTHKDLEKGRKIAGTGEILPDGSVGRIGGIQDKVVAAHEAGATIFLAPDDKITKEMKKAAPNIKTNYKEALEIAKERHYKMKIIPVKTAKEAIQYLEK